MSAGSIFWPDCPVMVWLNQLEEVPKADGGNSLRLVFFVKHCEMDEVPGFRMRGDWRCEAGEECGAELEQRRLIRSAGSVGDVACC